MGERQEFERALSQLPASLAAVTETIPAIIFIHQGGRCRFVNSAAERILGYPREQLFQRHVWEFVHPDYQELVRDRAMKREAGMEVPVRYEFPVITRGREVRWLDCSARRIEFDGRPAVLVCALDITARKRMESDLRASEERFRQVIEQIREVFWMSDPSMDEILYISPSYEEIWGRTCASLYASPRDWLEAIHADDRERVRQAALTREAHGDYCEVYRIVRPDGSTRWIEDRAFPVRNEAGEVYRIAGIAEDITVRKQATERGAAFARLGLQLSGVSTPREAASIIVGIASDLLGWDACYLHLYSAKQNRILPVLTMDTIHGQRVRVRENSFTPDPSPLMLEVMKDGPRIVHREVQGTLGSPVPPLVRFGDRERLSACMMYVPIRHGLRNIGILSIQSYTPHSYTPADLDTLQALADHCVGALARIQATANLKQMEQQFLEFGARA